MLSPEQDYKLLFLYLQLYKKGYEFIMLIGKMFCKYTDKFYKIETNGGDIVKNNTVIVDKGLLMQNDCPYWGECPYSDNSLSCNSFNEIPRESAKS